MDRSLKYDISTSFFNITDHLNVEMDWVHRKSTATNTTANGFTEANVCQSFSRSCERRSRYIIAMLMQTFIMVERAPLIFRAPFLRYIWACPAIHGRPSRASPPKVPL